MGNHDWANSEDAGDPDAWLKVAAADVRLVMPSRYYGRSADFFGLDTTVSGSDDAQGSGCKLGCKNPRPTTGWPPAT